MPIETTTTQLQSDSPIGLEVAHAYAQDVLVSLVGAGGEVRADAPLPAITEFPVYRPNEARLSLGLGFCHANRVLYASREWRQQARSNDAKVAQLPSVWNGFFLKRPKHTFERTLRNATLPGFKISSGLCGVEQSCWSACDEPMSQMIVPAILVHSFSNGTTEPRLDLDPRHLSAILNGVRSAVRVAVDGYLDKMDSSERSSIETFLRRTMFVVDTSNLRANDALIVQERVGSSGYAVSRSRHFRVDPVVREGWPIREVTNRVEFAETMLAAVALRMAAEVGVKRSVRISSERTCDGWRSSELIVDGAYQAFLFDHRDYGLALSIVEGLESFDQLPADTSEVVELARRMDRAVATVEAIVRPISTSEHLRHGPIRCSFEVLQVSGKDTKRLLRPALVELLAVIGEAHDNPYGARYNSVEDLATDFARRMAFSIQLRDIKVPKKVGAMNCFPIPGMQYRDSQKNGRAICWSPQRMNPTLVMRSWEA